MERPARPAGFKDGRKYTKGEPPGPYFYPGDDYVDRTASDGYNWGVSKRNQGDRWRQMLEIFDEFMNFARSTAPSGGARSKEPVDEPKPSSGRSSAGKVVLHISTPGPAAPPPVPNGV